MDGHKCGGQMKYVLLGYTQKSVGSIWQLTAMAVTSPSLSLLLRHPPLPPPFFSSSPSPSCFSPSPSPSSFVTNGFSVVGGEDAHVDALDAVQFNDGGSIRFAPIINGCWTMAGGHGRISEDQIHPVMEAYARRGLSSFDTADIYGPSETILGNFHQKWLQKHSHEHPLQIFTKFVPNIFTSSPSSASVEQAIRRSMQALRVRKLDLVQLHWWDYKIPGMVDAAKTLTDLREKGLITSIGATNMSTEALAQMVDAEVPVVSNQVQFSLLDRRPLRQMLDYCKQRDIKLLSYGSLAGGLLSDRYLQDQKAQKGLLERMAGFRAPDLNTSSLKMYWRIVKEAGGEAYWRRLLESLGRIAARRTVSVSSVALKWIMQQGPVYPIVGLRNACHLDDNLRVFSFSLTESDLAEIDEILQDSSGPKGDCYQLERGL